MTRIRKEQKAADFEGMTAQIIDAHIAKFALAWRLVAGEYLKLATLRCSDNQQWVVRSRKHFRWLPLCLAHARRDADRHAAILKLDVESVRVE
jgi:hypothetical protein